MSRKQFIAALVQIVVFMLFAVQIKASEVLYFYNRSHAFFIHNSSHGFVIPINSSESTLNCYNNLNTVVKLDSTPNIPTVSTVAATFESCYKVYCQSCDECDPTPCCVCTCIDGYIPNAERKCDPITCSEETEPYKNDSSITVIFLKTQAGFSATSVQACPENSASSGTPYGTRTCDLYGNWAETKWISSCNINIESYVNVTFENDEERQEAANNLEILTSEPEELNADNVTATAQGLQSIVNTNTLDKETSSSVIATIGNLLKVPDEQLQQSGETETLYQILDSVSEKVELKEGEEYNEVTSTVAVAVVQPTIEDAKRGIGYQFTALPTMNNLGFREDQLNTFFDVPHYNASSFIQLPYDAVQQSKENRISFYAFLDDTIFRTSTSSMQNDQEEISSEVIFSAAVVNAAEEINILEESVVMKFFFKSTLPDNKSVECVFWNEFENKWSNEGVTNQIFTNESAKCSFSHLTNFATLFLPTEKPDDSILDIITITGSAISSASLVLLIVTFVFFRNTRKERFCPAFLLINLAAALLTLDLLLIISELTFVKESGTGCEVIGILIHFFVLASALWMMVEAVNIYLAIVHALYARMLTNTRVVVCSLAVGWLIPIISVAVLAGIDAGTYYRREDGECWVASDKVIYIFVIPAAIILCINTILYIIIMIKMVCRKRQISDIQTRNNRSNSGKSFVLSLILFITFGGTWIFGFGISLFDSISEEVALGFAYIFSVCNALQGFFLFILYVVRQSASWKTLKTRMSTFLSTAFTTHRSYSVNEKKGASSTSQQEWYYKTTSLKKS